MGSNFWSVGSWLCNLPQKKITLFNNANDSAIAVPEPAEWAVIFGTLALGFAIYRRRK